MKKRKSSKSKRRDTWTMFPYRLAHHPLCKEFSNHVYEVRGHKVCRGCVNYYGGMILGVILVPVLIFILNINYLISFAITIGLFFFTPLSLLFNLPRPLKDVIRMMLGIAIICALATEILSIYELIINQVWWAFIPLFTIAALYIISKKYLTRYRNRKNEEVCRNCEQFYLPRCDGMSEDVDRILENRALMRKKSTVEH